MSKMTKGPKRPAGGRPPGRRSGAGIGPGPAYRPSTSGGGTHHKSGCLVWAVGALGALSWLGYRAVS